MTTNKPATIGHNSTNAFDLQKEVNGIMSDATAGNNRQIRTTLGFFADQQLYDLHGLLSGNAMEVKEGGKKSRNGAVKQLLQKTSPKFDEALKEASGKANSPDAFADREVAKARVDAAMRMTERALFSAYFLHKSGAVNATLKGNKVVVRYSSPYALTVIDGEKAKARETHNMTAATLMKAGKAMFEKNTATVAPAGNRANSGTSALNAFKSVKTVTGAIGATSKVLASLPADEADKVINSKEVADMLATMLRRQFAHDGVVYVAEIAEFIRDNVQGVRVETGKPEEKPKAKAS